MSKGEVILESQTEPEDEIVIKFFSSTDNGGSEAVYYHKLISRYNAEHDHVQVAFEGIATGDGFNKYLEQRLDSGQGDDLFLVNADSVKSLYSKGHFYDLSELPQFQQLNDAAREQSVIGSIGYCMPVDMTAYGLFVNLDMLKEYGLEAPGNLDEFLHCCRTVKEKGGTPLSLNRWYALTVPAMANGLNQIYGAENRQEILDKLNTGEAKIGDYMLDGFRVFEEFIEEEWYGSGLDGSFVDQQKAGMMDFPDFLEGKTAFYFGAVGMSRKIIKQAPQLNFQVQGVPVEGGTVSLPAVASRLSVNANGKHLEETLDFVSYLSKGAYGEISQEGKWLLPIYTDVDFKLDNEQIRPIYDTFLKGGQIPIEDMRLKFTYWDSIREICINMFDGMSAEEAAERYNRIQAEQIAEFND